MPQFTIDAVILQNFKNGVKAALAKAVSNDNTTYIMGQEGAYLNIDNYLDKLIDTFSTAVINECQQYVASNVDFRLQVIKISAEYNLPIDYIENYVLDKKQP